MIIKNSNGFRVTGMKSNDISIADQIKMIPFLWDVFTKTTWTVLNEDNGAKQLAAVRYNYTDDSFDYIIGIITGQKHGLPELVTPNADYLVLEDTGTMEEAREYLDNFLTKYLSNHSSVSIVNTVIELYKKTNEEHSYKYTLLIEVNDEKNI